MNCIKYWEKINKEEGEVYMWAAIGASALATALIVTVVVSQIQKYR